jgi:hypothetical protein
VGQKREGPQLRIGPVEAVEALAAEYSDSVHDILRWTPKRFNAFYKAMVQRKAIQSIEQQRNSIIAALYANSNWDQKEVDRSGHIKKLTEQFNEAMELVYSTPEDVRRSREHEIDWSNPFWQAAKRAQDRLKQRFGLAESTAEEREATTMSEEQLDARRRSRAEIDQV